jgi:phospholipid/cholesterol/gamma-HCH transport system permease protein
VEGGAEGVGRATTSAVVYSILWIIIADAVLTGLFFFAV